MDETHISGNTKVLQYSPNTVPPWQGAQAWQYMDVKDVAMLEQIGLTDVKVISSDIPTSFALSPAYPNPFNPATNIQYTLNKAGVTSLKVYNVLGQLVTTLVNNVYQQAGTYKVNVDMSGAGSGVYFSVLEQGQNRVAQKMVLLR